VAALRAAGCVFAEDEARLLLEQAGSREELARLVRLRVGGLPLEQVLGWAEFCGLRVSIDPGVFVPRRRTELVAREAARLAGSLPAHGPIVAVDLCCGSGALAAALASLLDRPVDLYAADIDPAAVACARRNLASFGAQVYQGDLYAALPERLRGTVSILIANVPYVPTGEIALLPPEAREHEPRIALDGGGDGLDVLRAVAAGAPGWLAPGGHLLVEAGRRQLQLAQRILSDNLLIPILVEDEDGEATAVVATRPAPAG
jgi:release factor glutamine methyltransferase